MKKNNLWHIIWVVGIYAVLVFILYLVILYKVKWEDKDLNKYLYIYECGNNICTTDNKVPDYLTSIICENKNCPYIKDVKNNILILKNNEKEYLYDLKEKKVLNDKYKEYYFTNNDDAYIVVDDNNLSGVINNENEVVVDIKYQKITDYKDNIFVYENNNKKGIENTDQSITIDATYDDIKIINNNLYTYLDNNEYYIASYTTKEPVNNEIYDYVYPFKDALLVAKNNQLDILDSNLRSNLIMKIDTYFQYKIEQERASLNIKEINNNLITFKIYDENNEYKNYIYDLKNKKIYN